MLLRRSQRHKEELLNRTMAVKHLQLMSLGGLYGREEARVMLRTRSMTGKEEVLVEVGVDLQGITEDDDGVGVGPQDGTIGEVVHGGL